MPHHLIPVYKHRLDVQLRLIYALDPSSILWHMLVVWRGQTLEEYLDLHPYDERSFLNDPRSVMAGL